jgi:spermidine synthase
MNALTAIFILSGAAGLIYESVWTRYLGLFVGHSAYAQVLVLAIFLGGMSLGAWLASERATSSKSPLRGYAYVELGIGMAGLLFHPTFVWATDFAYANVFPSTSGVSLTITKWAIAGALILPQSILCGATFPLMTAGAVRLFPNRPGRDLSLLYFANSFGAACGVLIAGFILLRLGGLPGTLLAAGIANVVVCIGALVADRQLRPEAVKAVPAPRVDRSSASAKGRARTSTEAAARRSAPWYSLVAPRLEGAHLPLSLTADLPSVRARLVPLLLGVSFGTAVASFIYEIAWIRMLSLVLSSATHSFELMLSAFILGIALGAYAIRSRVDEWKHPVFALGWIQWAMGILALATLPLYVASFEWMAALQEFFAPRLHGYELYMLARYGLSLVVMLPATICAGMTLPLITRSLLAAGDGERAIGRVYAVNTLGSIVGVVLAGLVLMPVLGLRLLLIAGALTDMALGALLLWPALRVRYLRRPRLAFGGIGLSAAAVLATIALVRLNLVHLTAGVYNYGSAALRRPDILHYYRDGRTATISVRSDPGRMRVTLATNGKPDASLDRAWLEPPGGARRLPLTNDQATQVLLPLVVRAHVRQARDAAVIGQGSGISSHFLLADPDLSSVDTIEIEPEIVAGSAEFYPANKRVFEDPRSHIVIDDAKSYFASGRKRFDLILSEPSNPWVSGVSGLFTVEFYRRVTEYLQPGGVLGQWLHMYQTNDAMILSVLAALDAVFSDYEIFMVSSGDMLIVATTAEKLPKPDWTIVDQPAIQADLVRALVPTPDDFERLRLAGRTAIHSMLRDIKPNSDYHPVLDLMADRARYSGSRAVGFYGLAEAWPDVTGVLAGRKLGFTSEIDAVIPGVPRIEAAAVGAQLRADRDAGPRSTLEPDGARSQRAAAAIARIRTLQAQVATNRPPSDWDDWLLAVARTEYDLHGGTSGVADARFYEMVTAYARAQRAPQDLQLALGYLRALREWDWPRVLEIAPALEAAHRRGDPWLPPDLLRDGTVLGAIQLGDTVLARDRFRALTPLRDTTDVAYRFRSALLRAIVE